MKIGFDAKRAFTNRAGLGNYSRNILNALATYYSEHRYYLYTTTNNQQLYPPQANQQIIIPKNLWKVFPALWRSKKIPSIIKNQPLDIFHGLSHELPVGIEKTGIKTVVTIHDLIFLRHPQFYRPVDRAIYYKKVKHACQVADCIIAISHQTRNDIVEFLGVSEDKIDVVYQPIAPHFFKPLSSLICDTLKIAYNLPESFMLNVGTIEPRKNLLTLLKAMVAGKIDIPLIVVGKPTGYMKKVTTFLQQHPELNVIFFHHAIDEELQALYQLADLLVYPSLFEGFGLPVVEAMACGTPVITSNAGSLPESGGDAAQLVDPQNVEQLAQAINQLLFNTKNPKARIQQLSAHVQQFTPEAAGKNLWNIYQKLS